MGAFARSWEITKLSIEVIKKDKELVAFPILSGFLSIMFFCAILIPVWIYSISANIETGQPVQDVIWYAILFGVYLGLAMIATFFNFCIVYTVKKRFEGKNATFGESIKFAFSRIGQIAAWGLVSATVGIILKLIERAADRQEGIGRLIGRIIYNILGTGWSIVTLFVIPAMVYKSLNPIESIKSSVSTLKKTWGESLILEFGTGLISMIFWIAGIIFWAVVMLFVALPLGGGAILIAAILALTYFVLVATIFSLIDSIFTTALYCYAETGKVPAFKPEILKGAFKRKN